MTTTYCPRCQSPRVRWHQAFNVWWFTCRACVETMLRALPVLEPLPQV